MADGAGFKRKATTLDVPVVDAFQQKMQETLDRLASLSGGSQSSSSQANDAELQAQPLPAGPLGGPPAPLQFPEGFAAQASGRQLQEGGVRETKRERRQEINQSIVAAIAATGGPMAGADPMQAGHAGGADPEDAHKAMQAYIAAAASAAGQAWGASMALAASGLKTKKSKKPENNTNLPQAFRKSRQPEEETDPNAQAQQGAESSSGQSDASQMQMRIAQMAMMARVAAMQQGLPMAPGMQAAAGMDGGMQGMAAMGNAMQAMQAMGGGGAVGSSNGGEVAATTNPMLAAFAGMAAQASQQSMAAQGAGAESAAATNPMFAALAAQANQGMAAQGIAAQAHAQAAQGMGAVAVPERYLENVSSMGFCLGGEQTNATEQALEAGAHAIRNLLPPEISAKARARLAMQYASISAQQVQLARQSQFHSQMRNWENQKAAGHSSAGGPLEVPETRFENGYRPTQLCKKFFLYEGCMHGQKCTFAHAYEELHPASAELIDLPRTDMLSEQKVDDFETQEPHMRMKKKREMCQRYQNKGECLLGKRCMFAHTEADLGKVELVYDDRVKTEICRKWEQGKCVFGRYCPHAHGIEQIGRLKPPEEICRMSAPIRPKEKRDDYRDRGGDYRDRGDRDRGDRDRGGDYRDRDDRDDRR